MSSTSRRSRACRSSGRPARPLGGAQPHRDAGGPRRARAADRSRCTISTTGRCSGRVETRAGTTRQEAVERATVVVGGRTEAIPLVGDRSASDTARALLDLGVELAIVKLGPDGVLGGDAGRGDRSAADPCRGRQRARRGGRFRRRPLSRAARRVAARADPAVRERCGCARRIAPRVRRRHADGRGGRGAARLARDRAQGSRPAGGAGIAPTRVATVSHAPERQHPGVRTAAGTPSPGAPPPRSRSSTSATSHRVLPTMNPLAPAAHASAT